MSASLMAWGPSHIDGDGRPQGLFSRWRFGLQKFWKGVKLGLHLELVYFSRSTTHCNGLTYEINNMLVFLVKNRCKKFLASGPFRPLGLTQQGGIATTTHGATPFRNRTQCTSSWSPGRERNAATSPNLHRTCRPRGHYFHDDVIRCKHFPRHWPFCGEFTGHWWIPLTKARDAGLWCFLFSAPESTVE